VITSGFLSFSMVRTISAAWAFKELIGFIRLDNFIGLLTAWVLLK